MDPEICSLIKCVFVALLFVRFFLVVVLGLLHQYDQSLIFLRGPKWAEHRKKWWNTARAIEYLPKICFLNVYFSNNRIQLLTSLRSLFVPCSSLSFTGSCVCYHNKIDSLNKWFKYNDCWENHMQYETGSHASISIPGNSLILPFPYSNVFWNLSKTSLILTMRMERGVHFSWNIISTYMKHNQYSSV